MHSIEIQTSPIIWENCESVKLIQLACCQSVQRIKDTMEEERSTSKILGYLSSNANVDFIE